MSTFDKINRKPSQLTLFPGGGEMQFYGQNDFADIWAFLSLVFWDFGWVFAHLQKKL